MNTKRTFLMALTVLATAITGCQRDYADVPDVPGSDGATLVTLGAVTNAPSVVTTPQASAPVASVATGGSADADTAPAAGALSAGAPADLATRATTTPLAKDSRVRLYVFPRGETDWLKLVATRAYVIADAAGTPQLESGEKTLGLDAADYDFYLVGPIDALDRNNNRVAVAAETSVTPCLGVDLYSSYTAMTVKVGNDNKLTPTPLSHRMVKSEFVINRPTDAAYTGLKVSEISLSDQPLTATFEFGADGGKVVPEAKLATLALSVTEAVAAEKYTALDYLFPQTSRDFQLKTLFEATLKDTKVYEQTARITLAFNAGEYHRFVAEPYTPVTMYWYPKLLPWDNVTMDTPSNDDELVFAFSSLDAPVTIDGNKYWRDRSGNGRNALMTGTMTYDATNKFYYQSGAQKSGAFSFNGINGVGVTDFGDPDRYQSYTLEIALVAKSGVECAVFSLGQNAKSLNKLRGIYCEVPWSKDEIHFDDCSSVDDKIDGRTAVTAVQTTSLKNLSTWTITRDATSTGRTNSIYCNGEKLVSQTFGAATLRLNGDDLSSTFCQNMTSDYKIYAVRFYRRVLTDEEIRINSNNDKLLYSTSASYKVAYDVNGGSGWVSSEGALFGTVVTLPAGPTAPTGKSFVGWTLAKDGSGTVYAAGSTLCITQNTTLYAQWA